MAAIFEWFDGGGGRLEEHKGAAWRLTRVGLVTGLSNTNADPRTYQEALDDAGVPAFGSSPTGLSNLVLTRRIPELLPGNTTKMKVTLEYEAKATAGLDWVFTFGSGLKQVERRIDRFGRLITVTDNSGTTQGGSVLGAIPETTLTATGKLQTNFPLRESGLWVGRINATFWADAPPGVWLCTRAEGQPLDFSTDPPTYEFTYEFLLNFLGHNPDVWFIDPDTGQPSNNITNGIGYKRVPIYPPKDFSQRFDI